MTTSMQDLKASFRHGSSEIDWCEDNYSITIFIAEFFNTISNFLFFAIPPLLIYLFQNYAKHVSQGINLIWVMMVVVGAGSTYFHATLSLVGQLLDELAILWVLMTGIALWIPRHFLSSLLNVDRERFRFYVLFFAVLSSGLACINPFVNAFVLMGFGPVTATILVNECRRSSDARARRLGLRSLLLFIAAFFCWINDRIFCSVWRNAHFPYLHGFWHILIFLSSYTCCVLMAYFDACTEVPDLKPVLCFWPNNERETMGIPFVTFKSNLIKKKTNMIWLLLLGSKLFLCFILFLVTIMEDFLTSVQILSSTHIIFTYLFCLSSSLFLWLDFDFTKQNLFTVLAVSYTSLKSAKPLLLLLGTYLFIFLDKLILSCFLVVPQCQTSLLW